MHPITHATWWLLKRRTAAHVPPNVHPPKEALARLWRLLKPFRYSVRTIYIFIFSHCGVVAFISFSVGVGAERSYKVYQRPVRPTRTAQGHTASGSGDVVPFWFLDLG